MIALYFTVGGMAFLQTQHEDGFIRALLFIVGGLFVTDGVILTIGEYANWIGQ